MAERHVRVVSLWIHEGQEAAFEAFEREAARLMAKHGGRIDAAVRTALPGSTPSPESPEPYEIHVVSFRDKAAWEAYQGDPETLSLRENRSKIVSRTTLMEGREAGPY